MKFSNSIATFPYWLELNIDKLTSDAIFSSVFYELFVVRYKMNRLMREKFNVSN